MMSLEFGFRFGKYNVITGWIYWKFHTMIFVKVFANESYKARWFTQKEFASPQIFSYLKSLLKSDSHFPKIYIFWFALMIALQKCFLFHLKSFFSFSRYLNFFLGFLACRKDGLMRKLSLISKFMTSQPG